MHKTKLLTTAFVFLSFQLISAQSLSPDELAQMDSTQLAIYFQAHMRKVDSLAKIDYIAHEYKYLNKDFTIDISAHKFQKTMKQYEYIPQRIRNYNDSLSVVLMAEFNDSDQACIANLRISYSWQRLAFHTWQTPEEAKAFAAQFGITHPWRMNEFLKDEENTNQSIVEFFNNLRLKVEKETGKTRLDNLCRKELLNNALRCNPDRIKAINKRREEINRAAAKGNNK